MFSKNLPNAGGQRNHRPAQNNVKVSPVTVAILPAPATLFFMRAVLFICTANYYRSRFCEHLFNDLAARQNLDCQATSRAVALELGTANVGPISPLAIAGLQARGVPLPDQFRAPLQLTEADLKSADPVIVLDADEHRPLLTKKFPDWAERVTYWNVGDLHVATPAQALAVAEQAVRALIHDLARTGGLANQTAESDPAGPWDFCPRCSSRLVNQRCKFVCRRCGYFMSCSDFDV